MRNGRGKIRQDNFTRSDWLKYLVFLAPQALRRAIRYSQIFLFPKESRWKEIRELNLIETNRFSEFIDACLILQEEHRKLENFIKTVEAELKRITPMETLVYASLFAFKHLVFNQGQQALRPELLDIHQADKNRDYFQRMTDAINQILMSKLKKSSDKDFCISERIIGESLRKHMAPLLFPSPRTALAANKSLTNLNAFERLVGAYLHFNDFMGKTISWFCFDDDYDIRFEGEKLIIFPQINPDVSECDQIGKKSDRLHQYWFFRGLDECLKPGFEFEYLGRLKYDDSHLFAWTSAIRTKLELKEIYGIDDEIMIDNSYKINTFQALFTIEMMHAFYKDGYILPYCKLQEQTGNWLTALISFSFMGLIEGEIRLPITFAERKAKINRICGWISSEDWPTGNKQMTEAILDFWSNDLKDSSRHLRQNEHSLHPDLHERPIFKIGNYLFELPWVFAFQNNVTAAVNNLRRLGRNRDERNIETNRIEKRLAENFEQFGFKVICNYLPHHDADDDIGEIDLISFLDDHLFIFEIKSGYMRRNLRDAWQHKTSTLRKAALQLKRKSAFVTERLKTDPTLLTLINNRDSSQIYIHSWIIDTSIEYDHEYFGGFLKISIQELIIALRNERHLLRDMHQVIVEQRKCNDDSHIKSHFKDICSNAMTAISVQNPEDNLYPSGFTVDQFVAVIENGLIWKIVDSV